MKFERLLPRWLDEMVIIAATGPSMTRDVADRIRDHRVITVSDAYRLLPDADVLYSADAAWWRVHNGAPSFSGEKWTTYNHRHGAGSDVADQYGLHVINGRSGSTFSRAPDLIHWGQCSGFQAINLAILWGAKRIILVGYNMQVVNGQKHFFGNHPRQLNNTDLKRFVPHFETAAKELSGDIEIINATPNSALTCFMHMELDDAIGCLTAL